MRLFTRFFMTLLCSVFTIAALAELPTQSTLTPSTAKTLYNPAHNAVAGNPEGSVTLVELFDYNCMYCRKLQPVIDLMIERNPDLRVIYKEHLLFGDTSLAPTQAALAAQMQDKYLSLHGALLRATKPLTEEEIMNIAKAQGLDIEQLKKDMVSNEVNQQIEDSNALIQELGIQGAPVVIVSGTGIATDPEKNINQTQYIAMGFDNAIRDIQALIDKVKAEE